MVTPARAQPVRLPARPRRSGFSGRLGSASRDTIVPALPGRPAGSPTYAQELWTTARVIALGGVIAGLAIGALLRGGMLLLRVAQESAIGLTSDDGFLIGQVTLSGTYALLVLGVALGFLGTAAYVAVTPFLIGPPWSRVATVGITAMLLGGAVAIQSDGIDFTALDTELAVAVFLVVPLLSGLLVPPVVHWVDRRIDGLPPWPFFAPLMFPQALPVLVIQLIIVSILLPFRRALLGPVLAHLWSRILVSALFALIPLFAMAALAQDLREVL